MFLIEHNNKVIGTYNDYEQAELFINSCLQNNFIKNAKILTYKINSCLLLSTKNFPEEVILQKETKKEVILETKKVILELSEEERRENDLKMKENIRIAEEKKKESVELQHKINMLKVYKDRIEESKKVYENDLKLFNLFEESKKNNDFVIPELFIEKYNLFKKLKDKDALSWESFVKEYKFVNYYDDHFKLTSYEEKFINYESDSETEDSEKDIIEELNI